MCLPIQSGLFRHLTVINVIVGIISAFIICIIKHNFFGGIYTPIPLDSSLYLAFDTVVVGLGVKSLIKPLAEYLAESFSDSAFLNGKITQGGELHSPFDKTTDGGKLDNPYDKVIIYNMERQPGNIRGNLQGGNRQNNPMGSPQAGPSQAQPANPQQGLPQSPSPAPASPRSG